ncbi:MAG: SURF1 family protein [Gemmatimonadaceae bacterium]
MFRPAKHRDGWMMAPVRKSHIVLSIIALAVALGCFRLSKWQVDRRAQRRARIAVVAQRLAAPTVPLSEIPADTSQGHYRRVALSGVLDYEREVALALRSRDGSPGVYILTPLRTSDSRVVLVNRGWVYAPDGMTFDHARWREQDTVAVDGFLETFVAPRGRVSMDDRPKLVRRLVRDSLTPRTTTTALFPYVVVVTQPAPASAPARIAPPSLSEGSHLSYAIQWAALGVIAIVGMVLSLRRGVTERRENAVAPSVVAG